MEQFQELDPHLDMAGTSYCLLPCFFLLFLQDGGCTCPGDVSKAFGGGADFVMLGGMLAGHDESSGETVEIGGKKFKKFYGMSSTTAMTKYAGSVAEYRASEGKTVLVPYRGPIASTMQDVLGGQKLVMFSLACSSLFVP